jgi:hypothetical protein
VSDDIKSQLRKAFEWSNDPMLEQAADRIAELEAENKTLRDALYIDDLTVTLQGKDRAAAITGMERALDLINADLTQEAKASLRTTLAELKGETDGR